MVVLAGGTRLAVLPSLFGLTEEACAKFANILRIEPRRTRLRDRHGPPNAAGVTRHDLVRTPWLDADHRDPSRIGRRSHRRWSRRRIREIETNKNIALIEQPEYKRRWNTEPWEAQEERALRNWLLDRLEDARHWPVLEITSCARLADRVRQDPEFMQVAQLYRGRADFDLVALVIELVESESVPYLPVLRYKATGLQKRALWERTWALQRREDAGEDVGKIDVPPKYTSADFLSGTYWRLRGKLDVPKERFVLYPGAERDADPTPAIAWAGWDHLQQARALAAYYVDRKENDGWSPSRLTPLLAGLLELLPWLKQWHNDIDPTYGVGMGDYFDDFVREEAKTLDVTLETVRAWQPAAGAKKRTAKARGAGRSQRAGRESESGSRMQDDEQADEEEGSA